MKTMAKVVLGAAVCVLAAVLAAVAAPARFKAPAGTVLTYDAKRHRLYIHLNEYNGGELLVDFGDEVEAVGFLHDGSELAIDRGDPWSIRKNYRHGGEGKMSIRLPDLKPQVVNPVVEVVLKRK